ncbi:MAG: glycosyltransferase family 4 protein [Thermodesulfobacteriota bacterium]|nr:glycosyltransferase family 4 protein [Thermodesulfobacteriota bacterium]
MHILIIHQAFASPNEPGGTRHYELARYLVQQGHQVTIVASDLTYLTGRRESTRNGFSAEENLGGVRILRAYTYAALHRSFCWRVLSFFSFMATSVLTSMRVSKVDVVMGTSPPIFQAFSAWLVAALRGRPFLLEIRDLWPEFAIDMGVLNNPLLIRLSRWLEMFLYRKSDHLLVNSPAYRDYLVAKGVAKARITLIPNGVDPDLFHPRDKGWRIRNQLGMDGRFLVTYAGALGLANDIPTILRAASRLTNHDDIRFLLVGDGKQRRHSEGLASEMGLKNVVFAGSRPKSEMPEILAASDVCIATLKNIPMFRTTYPNKVFDYMAAGRPTILAIDGVIRQVVESAKGGVYVPPGDDAALAEAARILKKHPKQAEGMGVAARSYVVRHFNRHQQAQAFGNLVERLAEQNAASLNELD